MIMQNATNSIMALVEAEAQKRGIDSLGAKGLLAFEMGVGSEYFDEVFDPLSVAKLYMHGNAKIENLFSNIKI